MSWGRWLAPAKRANYRPGRCAVCATVTFVDRADGWCDDCIRETDYDPHEHEPDVIYDSWQP